MCKRREFKVGSLLLSVREESRLNGEKSFVEKFEIVESEFEENLEAVDCEKNEMLFEESVSENFEIVENEVVSLTDYGSQQKSNRKGFIL